MLMVVANERTHRRSFKLYFCGWMQGRDALLCVLVRVLIVDLPPILFASKVMVMSASSSVLRHHLISGLRALDGDNRRSNRLFNGRSLSAIVVRLR